MASAELLLKVNYHTGKLLVRVRRSRYHYSAYTSFYIASTSDRACCWDTQHSLAACK